MKVEFYLQKALIQIEEAIISKNKRVLLESLKDMLFKTTGAYKEKKDQNLFLEIQIKCSQSYTGIAGVSDNLKENHVLLFKDRKDI